MVWAKLSSHLSQSERSRAIMDFSAWVYGPNELNDKSERSQTVKVDGLKILNSESWRYYNLK